MDAQQVINNASRLLKQKKYIESLEAFNKVIEIEPDNHTAWCKKGIALIYLKQYEEAIKSCNRAITIKHSYYTAWEYKVLCLRRLQQYQEANDLCDRILKIFPDADHKHIWSSKAYSLYILEKYQESLEAYQELANFDPLTDCYLYDRGLGLETQGKLKEALNHYDRCLKINSDYYHAWERKYILVSQLNKHEEALIIADKLLELQPNNAVNWDRKSYTLFNLQKYRESLKAIEQAIKINSNNSVYNNENTEKPFNHKNKL